LKQKKVKEDTGDKKKKKRKVLRPRKYKPVPLWDYETARQWVQNHKIDCLVQYRNYHEKYGLPPEMPIYPSQVYSRKKWNSWRGAEDFWYNPGYDIKKERKHAHILPYEDAQMFCRALKITTWRKYQDWVDSPRNRKFYPRLPQEPQLVYEEWVDWGTFTGTGFVCTRKRKLHWLPFEAARSFVQQLKLTCVQDWMDWKRTPDRPKYIPSQPNLVYKDKWKSTGDWIGTEIMAIVQSNVEPENTIWAIVHDPSQPPNMFIMTIFKGGVRYAWEKCKEKGLTLKRCYMYEPDLQLEVNRIVLRNCGSFSNGTFVTPNYAQLQFDLDMVLIALTKL